MPDQLGPITIPDPPSIPAFPFTGEYGSGFDYKPPIAAHVFDQPGLKTEQRYLIASGARRFRVSRSRGLVCNDYANLKAHFEQAQGSYAQFPFTVKKPDGDETVTARYENSSITLDHLYGFFCSDPGITLLEIPQPAPPYTSVASVTRFPDAALTAALQSQVQQFIPLITITPRDGSAPARISNQRLTVDGVPYIPRLLNWSGISQTLSESSDAAQFTFGNADDAFTQWGNQVNLFRALIQFSLFHVNTSYRIDMWAGYGRAWTLTSDGKFVLPASDGVFQLGIAYPSRTLSRTCWKVYKGRFCPSISPLTDCPKDYQSCVVRGVQGSFGGVVAQPQTVHIKDNTTGVLGFGRSIITSVSVANDSIYQRPVQEIYTDENMLVNCDVATGRDESEFYSALGVVGEGPIGGYAQNLLLHTLDGQPPHDPLHKGGWRGIVGNDPANTASDYFAIDQAPWTIAPPGSTYAGGLAFAEIRRTDQAGLQLAPVADRAMQVTVSQGISGWTWTAPGNRVWTAGLSNTIWVAINVYLRGIGLRVTPANASDVSAPVMEQYFDVDQAIAMAAICDTLVDKLVGSGQERQFPFRGVLKEQKPLKDWLTEILNCCLGYYTFVNGKLWVGIRENSSVLAGNAFTRDTILYQSMQATPLEPQFNWLDGQFGDEEFNWALNTVSIYDIDAAGYIGQTDSPMFTKNSMTFVGVSNKSQCARIVTTRLREEIGGVGLTEQMNARNLQFRTTLLAMRTMVGDIISLDHTRLPAGRCEGRVQKWTLNPDFSIDIITSAATDSMYDLDVGPKPADVPADPVVPELLQSINGLAWMPNHVAPFPGDPLYPDGRERTFDLWQDYNVTRDGVWAPAIWVGGEEVINQFAAQVQPRVLNVQLSAGGQISGPCSLYVAVTQTDAAGQPSFPSNMYGIYIPDGVVNQQVTLTMSPAPSGSWTGWDLYIGTDRRRIALQESHTGAPPGTYTYSGLLAQMTQELPEPAAQAVRIAAKHVWHSGIAGVLVTGVPANDQIQCNDYIGSTDNWVGRIVSALADLSDGSAPLWNFTVTAFDVATGTFKVSPDCVRADPADSVQEGDVLIMRSIATSADANTVTDAMWANTVTEEQFPGTSGLRPSEEAGRICRIIRGKGAGQLRLITDNTNITLDITPPWDTIPDATSIIIVEAHDWDYVSTTSQLTVPRPGQAFELRLRTDNLADRVALVGGFLVNDQGRITDEEFAVYREIYIYGEPPTVRVIGPAKWDPDRTDPDGTHDPGPWQVYPTDTTIRADTSGGVDVEAQLMPLATYQGRTLYFSNDNGPNNLIVSTQAGELLFDGNTSVTVAPLQTVRITAG
jgi:hypothetical protein